jgi:hypothetical protein
MIKPKQLVGPYTTSGWGRTTLSQRAALCLASILICLTSAAIGLAQQAPSAPASSGTLNPAYLKQFPSVDQVMTQLKGTDAKDTTNLELGTFRQLQQMIQDLAGSRWVHNQMTPDESRLLGAYSLAYNNLAKPLNYPFDNYFNQPALLTKLASTFSMAQVISQWEGGNQKAAAASGANLPPPPKPAPNPANSSRSARSNSAAGAPLSASAAVNRCVELGGGAAVCQAGASSAAMYAMLPASARTPAYTGLRLTGSWKSSSGFGFDFGDAVAQITGCGQLQADNHYYTVQQQGNQIAIQIDSQPRPIQVALGADGKLAGPATVAIAGQAIVGYQNGTAETKDLRTNQAVPGTVRNVHDPIYAAKTVNCGVGAMSPGKIDSPDTAAFMATGENPAVMLFPDVATAQRNEAAGARMLGTYAGAGGLKIQFQTTGAIIDCSQAHVASLYSVANTASGVAVVLKNGSSPIILALQPNGTLTGAGTVKVDGRLVSGQNGAGFVFTPVSAQCTVGTLAITN